MVVNMKVVRWCFLGKASQFKWATDEVLVEGQLTTDVDGLLFCFLLFLVIFSYMLYILLANKVEYINTTRAREFCTVCNLLKF